MRFSCYPFMREKGSLVDFEIRTDSLTTRIGAVLPALRGDDDCRVVYEDLQVIQPIAYHVNGSVRGRLAISEEDLHWLSERYDFYIEEVGDVIKQFVLPQGCEAGTLLHVCRSEAKKSYRALHKVSEEREVPEILFDYLGLLANVFFVMAVYTNRKKSVDEIPFVSKAYPIKKKRKEETQ